MKSKLSIFIGFTGWFIFISYFAYEYNEYGKYVFLHILTPAGFTETFFHFLIIITPISSTVIAFLTNERKKLLEKTILSEKQLGHAAYEWKVTFDALPYGVMLVDKDFNILRINKYFSELYNIPIKDLISKKCYQLLHETEKPKGECPLCKSLKPQRLETYEFYSKNFNKYFRVNISPVVGEDSVSATFLHILLDITESKIQKDILIDSRNAFFNMLKDTDKAHKDLKELHNELIIAFANAIDAKNHWTKGHSIEVAKYAVAIAKKMGINETDRNTLYTAALLHDIGKIGTVDGILDKHEQLTKEEFGQIMKHPIQGEEILKPIKGLNGVLSIIRSHHEKIDGKGYPDNLEGNQIPILARILCVADSFDSMVSNRPYRAAISEEDAVKEIRKCSGTHFDSDIVDAFQKLFEEKKI